MSVDDGKGAGVGDGDWTSTLKSTESRVTRHVRTLIGSNTHECPYTKGSQLHPPQQPTGRRLTMLQVLLVHCHAANTIARLLGQIETRELGGDRAGVLEESGVGQEGEDKVGGEGGKGGRCEVVEEVGVLGELSKERHG